MNEITTLADLKPDQHNARKHNPRNIGMIVDSLGKVGAARSIVIDEDGNILAGNGTVEALGEAGIEKVRVIETDGDEIVAVQRKGLSPEQKTALALADNRTAELAEWDPIILKEIHINTPEILENMFVPLELDELLNLDTDLGFQEGEDDAPEPPEDPITKQGDLYQLGDHRLMCGDSTNEITVGILMDGHKADMVFTDPPYGIKVVKGGMVGANFGVAKKGQYKDVFGDETTETAWKAVNLCKELGIEKLIFWGGNYYASHLDPSSCWLVWDKRSDSGIVNTFADAELAWTNISQPTRIYRQLWNGMIREGEHDKRVHPTQKPVALAEWSFKNYGEDNDLILDLFGGSGSTLIACEKLERKCYMMEIDPAYCDVIVKRWEEFTGKKAELINQGAIV